MTDQPPTCAPAVHLAGEPDGATVARHRRVVVDLTALVVVAVFVAGLVGVAGVRSRTVSAEAGGTRLEVRYAQITRGGLATPFDVSVSRPGGFDGPVQVGVSRDYLAIFDENGLDPDPASATTMGPFVLWEFEPPVGEQLDVSLDARIEPAVHWGEPGTVVVLEDGSEVVRVDLRTTVLP